MVAVKPTLMDLAQSKESNLIGLSSEYPRIERPHEYTMYVMSRLLFNRYPCHNYKF